MRMFRKIGCIVFAVVMLLTSVSFAIAEEKATKIEVKEMPAKTVYTVDEEFSGDGCVLTVTYADGTTKDITLAEEGIEVTAPSTGSVGKKNVRVRYAGERLSFQITVVKEKLEAAFILNDGESEPVMVAVEKGEKLTEPETPQREGYSFAGWFADEQCTMSFDFGAAIEASTNIYAKWISDSAESCNFVFNFNQEELAKNTVVQQVEIGKTATPLTEVPERTGYAFVGWYTMADGGEAFDFSTPIAGDTEGFANWQKTAGEQTYVFEAEDTSLTGKSGPAFSGTAMEAGMIVYDNKHGESNDRFVGYLYQRYNSLEFFINADEAVDNATLVVRMSAEMRDYTYNSGNFSISVNGESYDYGDIVFTNVPANSYNSVECLPFEDYTISTSVKLKKGMNLITLMTDNDDPMAGSTLLAAAPLIDCIKLTTTAVLTWSETMGLPAANY